MMQSAWRARAGTGRRFPFYMANYVQKIVNAGASADRAESAIPAVWNRPHDGGRERRLGAPGGGLGGAAERGHREIDELLGANRIAGVQPTQSGPHLLGDKVPAAGVGAVGRDSLKHELGLCRLKQSARLTDLAGTQGLPCLQQPPRGGRPRSLGFRGRMLPLGGCLPIRKNLGEVPRLRISGRSAYGGLRRRGLWRRRRSNGPLLSQPIE